MKAGIVGIRKQVMGKAGGISPAYQGLLLVAVVLCALSVVTSQHKARKLFIELQKEKEQAQKMDVEWGQLQLEQSTWATPGAGGTSCCAKVANAIAQEWASSIYQGKA